ncbi:MAG: hypothetical protein J6J90_01905 [Angelakisella sp.]|nr:hypothetical protein [Angelakisella sp.]
MKWLRGIAALLCAVAIGMLPALAVTGEWVFGTFEDPQGSIASAEEQPSEPETEEKGAAEDEPSQDNPQQDNPQQDNPQQDNPQQETLPQPNRQDSWDDDIRGNWNGQTASTPNLESPSDAQREEEQKRLEQAQKELEREQQQREEAFREAERQNARQPEQQEEEQQQGKGGASQEETAAPSELVLPVREQSGSVSAVRYLLIGALLATACCIAVYLLCHPQEEDEDPDHTKGTGGD